LLLCEKKVFRDAAIFGLMGRHEEEGRENHVPTPPFQKLAKWL
jgi:hypothetical protein